MDQQQLTLDLVFLYRPSLRRLIARLRNAKSPEESPLSDEDKEVISMTYGACRAITAISAWTSRTVSDTPELLIAQPLIVNPASSAFGTSVV